jgi:hypothetical protein
VIDMFFNNMSLTALVMICDNARSFLHAFFTALRLSPQQCVIPACTTSPILLSSEHQNCRVVGSVCKVVHGPVKSRQYLTYSRFGTGHVSVNQSTQANHWSSISVKSGHNAFCIMPPKDEREQARLAFAM